MAPRAIDAASLDDTQIEGDVARRQPRSDRRRHLEQTATQLIQERGFDRVSVNDLAERAQMSVGGLYRYIKNKSDLLVMACEGIYGGLHEEITAAAEGEDHAERLRRAMTTYFDACRTNREQILLMYREYRNLPADAKQRYVVREQAITDLFADIIRTGVTAGTFRVLDANIVAHDIVFLGHFPALKGWAAKAHPESTGLVGAQVDFLLGSLTAH